MRSVTRYDPQIPMRKRHLIFLGLAIFSLLLAFEKIVLHLHFIWLPLFFPLLGFGAYLVNGKRAVHLFFFLLPLINSTPDIFFNGYPYNYMGIILFLLAGLVLASLVKKEGWPFDFKWADAYLLFLAVLSISVLFVFLRWSNLTLSLQAFMKDTPVTPSGERGSFASIFPIITLFIFSFSPLVVALIKRHGIKVDTAFRFILGGFSFSFLIGLVQRFLDPDFLAQRWWGEKMAQYNAGFSDFNSFGFFSGILFLYLVLSLVSPDRSQAKPAERPREKFFGFQRIRNVFYLLVTLAGAFLSGSRTAFFFILLALGYLLLTKKIKIYLKLAAVLVVFVALVAAGGTLKTRMAKTIEKVNMTLQSADVVKKLDEISNQRISMIKHSIPMLRDHPLTGIGCGNFLFYLKYILLGSSAYQDLPLNQYLLVWDETGFIGLLAFLLFLFQSIKGTTSPKIKFLLLGFALVFVFHTPLWLPEIVVLFWTLNAFSSEAGQVRHRYRLAAVILVSIFVVGNIIDFRSLHPARLAEWSRTDYDYGFWYWEQGEKGRFRWSHSSAGIYFFRDQPKTVLIYCGAPLAKLKGQRQEVDVFWQGKWHGRIVFESNRFQRYTIPDRREGFLELRVSPVFNLKSMGLAEDTRDLGIQIYQNGQPLAPHPGAEGQVEVFVRPETDSVFQGEKLLLQVDVNNRSAVDISGADNFFFSYHLYDENKRLLAYDNPRFVFPVDIEKNTRNRFALPIYLKEPKGKYWIELDVVKEGEFWGSKRNWKTAWIAIEVKTLVSEGFKKKYLRSYVSADHTLVNREQWLLRVILKNCELFANNTLFGFSAGSTYPAVWIRDLATFEHWALYFYPLQVFCRGNELFFANQSPEGEIADWISVDGRSAKNTVETDQESSLVLAAYEVALEDPGWLQKRVKGSTVLTRLEMALEWVWRNRRDKNWQLITSGLTADWGDVENTYPDQRAIRLSDRSTPVFSIYTQAKYIQAIGKLLELLHYSGETGLETKWRERLEILKFQTRRVLYQQEKGYFLIHRIPSHSRFDQLEQGMLAVGGNAEAILAGLLTRAEIDRFIAVLKERRKKYQLSTVSFTLLPPYPEGFFPHPILSRPWTYQNGGEWDWIGGRVVKALFSSGFRREAKKYMLELIKKHLRHFNIFEWEDKNGNPHGALFYVGAAGVMGEAIMKGYLGIDQDFNRYRVLFPDAFSELKVARNGSEFVIQLQPDLKVMAMKLKKKLFIYVGGQTNPVIIEGPGSYGFSKGH